MALSKDLLARLGEGSELARACDRASVELKLVLACYDGLAATEEKALGEVAAALLSAAEVKELVDQRLGAIKQGAPEEDRMLELIGDTLARVPEALRTEVARAMLSDALPVISTDKVVSRQERELVLDQVASALGLEKAAAQEILEQYAAKAG